MLDTVIDPDSALPPYEQLGVIVLDEIAQGYLSGKVPSVHEIGEHHRVSHRVAERALSILEGEGLLVKVSGKGHFVRKRQIGF